MKKKKPNVTAPGLYRGVTTINHKRGGWFQKLKQRLKTWRRQLTVNRSILNLVFNTLKVLLAVVKLFEFLRGCLILTKTNHLSTPINFQAHAPYLLNLMINRALRMLRVFHGLKQKDLALRLEISSSHLSEIESGAKKVSYELLEKYAKVLDTLVSTIAIFAEASDSKDTKSMVNRVSNKALRLLEWLDTISKVTPQDASDGPRN